MLYAPSQRRCPNDLGCAPHRLATPENISPTRHFRKCSTVLAVLSANRTWLQRKPFASFRFRTHSPDPRTVLDTTVRYRRALRRGSCEIRCHAGELTGKGNRFARSRAANRGEFGRTQTRHPDIDARPLSRIHPRLHRSRMCAAHILVHPLCRPYVRDLPQKSNATEGERAGAAPPC
jgi:hypothetical protein